MNALKIKPNKAEEAKKSSEEVKKASEATKDAAASTKAATDGAKIAAMVAKATAEETKKSVPKSPHKKSMKTKDATVTMQKVGADGKITPIKSEKISEEDSPSTRTHVAVKTAKGL